MASDFLRQIAQAQRELKELDARIGRSLPQAAEAGAVVLHDAAKELAPVGTGKLRDGMGHRAEKKSATSASHLVFNGVFYARFVEYGTSKMRKRPFMRPAADGRQSEIVAAMERVVLSEDGI